MQSTGAARERPLLYYGWVVVIGCSLVTLSQGETMYSFGVYLKALESDFGLNRALASSAYSAFLLGYAMSVVVTGRLGDRYNPRPILLISTLVSGLGMAACYLARDINQLRLCMLVSGLGAGPTWAIPTSVVQGWFRDRGHGGLALGIVTCGAGVGMLVYPPVVNYLITAYGWRITCVILAVLLVVITGTGGSLVKKNTPGRVALSNSAVKDRQLSFKGLMLDPAYLCVLFAVLAGIFVFQSMVAHLVAFSTDIGTSPAEAAFAFGLIGAFSIPGRILSGVVADKVGWRFVLSFSLFAMGAALMLLLMFKGSLVLYSFAFVFGLGQGIRSPAQVGLLGFYFGMRNLGLLIGITIAAGQVVSVLAPYFCGFVYDQTQSYFIAFAGLAVLVIAVGFLTMSLKRAPDQESLDTRESMTS